LSQEPTLELHLQHRTKERTEERTEERTNKLDTTVPTRYSYTSDPLKQRGERLILEARANRETFYTNHRVAFNSCHTGYRLSCHNASDYSGDRCCCSVTLDEPL